MGSLGGRGNDGFEGFVGHSHKNGGVGHKLMHTYLDTHNIHAYTYFEFEGEFLYMYVCMFCIYTVIWNQDKII